MDQKILGKKLLKARGNCGLNQHEVEKALDLPQKAITRIESGERLVSTLELAKLAALYHQPIADFFTESDTEEDLFLVLHRLEPGIEKNRKINEEVARCIHICREGISIKKLLNRYSQQQMRSYSSSFPENTIKAIEEGEKAAKDERRCLGIGYAPIGDIAELFSSQGLWCAGISLLPEMSGLFLQHASLGRVILVNASHAPTRQRFSYAHEYAHALFDHASRVLISNATNSSDLIEKRANAFAAALLLPSEGIEEMVRNLGKGHSSRNFQSVFDVARESSFDAEERQVVQKITPQDVAIIARHFKVSYQATVYRLHSLRYLNAKEKEVLLALEDEGKQYLALIGFLPESEKSEKSSSSKRELKTYISQLIIDAYRQEAISRGRFFELCKLIELPAEKLLSIAENIS